MKRATRKELEEQVMRLQNQIVILQHRDEQQTKVIDYNVSDYQMLREASWKLEDEKRALERKLKEREQVIGIMETQLLDEKQLGQRAVENAQAFLQESQKAVEGMLERGKVISILVEKIRQLENAQS